MSPFSDDRDAEMRELFFESTQEQLQSMNDEAMNLEKHPDDAEVVRSIRRIVHTLKGDAAACGFSELSNAAHELEDALALESVSSPATLVEIAFTAADTFGALVSAYRQGGKLPSLEPLRNMVRELAGLPKTKRRSGKKEVPAAAHTGWSEYELLAVKNAQAQGRRVYHVTAEIDRHCLMPIAARQLVMNALGGWAEVLATRPESPTTKNSKPLELLVASEKPAEQVAAKCRIPTVISNVTIELLKGTALPPKAKGKDLAPSQPAETQAREEFEEAANAPQHAAAAPAENILRVDAGRIDNVLNLVGELIIGKSMLQQALNEFARHSASDGPRSRFSDAMAFQSRVLNDLQRSVMKIRMVPFEQLFRRFPRMVRDVARQCGKEVELIVRGEDTDLDKTLLDAIAEPLTHLVRNAVSHGIENAEERTRSGKPARGTLQLISYHHGNQVIVEVRDDGRGIDSEKVKLKAVEKGLITPEELARLSETEILNLVFLPGFSTAEAITEVSGRGVGLDVVKSVLHRLKGSADIETRPGQGTTFRMKLPLTLAIIKALLFRVEQRLYAVPLNAVAEISRARESDLHQVDNCEVLQLRDKVLPVARLGSAPSAGAGHDTRKFFVLVISLGERHLGLMVDALEGEEELVIKAIDDHAVATNLISGASILGDGRVVLIVNLPAIVERHARSRPQQAGAVTSGILRSHADRSRRVHGAEEVQP